MGIPVAYWILAAALIVAAIGLGVLGVWIARRGRAFGPGFVRFGLAAVCFVGSGLALLVFSVLVTAATMH